MSNIHFITHPEVVVDPAKPVPRWCLSDKGIARMRLFAASPVMARVTDVWASDETKAIEAAGILAGFHGLPVQVLHALHENDRSATGFLPPHEFEAVADRFFAAPNESVRGWERAADAQARILRAFHDIAAKTEARDGDVAIVAHGGVGTLLLCALSNVEIERSYDQPFQGHYWTWSRQEQRVVSGWKSIAPA